jgi:hypothetical protein
MIVIITIIIIKKVIIMIIIMIVATITLISKMVISIERTMNGVCCARAAF